MRYATRFSNKANTHASSLGTYVTSSTYDGKHGYSERLIGLQPGVNSNAMSRDIVIHAAPYMTNQFITAHDRGGRSWGCFAVSPKYSKKLIHLVDGGSVLFAYAPQVAHTDYTDLS